jgi:hypothetical protein
MLVSYYPKAGKDEEFLALLGKHWPTLDRIGLVSKMPPQLWRATDKRTNQNFYIEMFQWRDAEASEIAHQTPEVMSIWEPMGPLLETMQLTRVEPLVLPVGQA